ncbi:MAG: DNA polymerase III subunit gamma/tau [Alphaproteobacteria bacterium]|nr:DNA polymerase III subunit gamma/tau [Alphaproteobacteria bacterium]
MADDMTGTGGDGGAQRYVVLARKYRPQTFEDLIGQEAMVTTLKNAFATDRIAQGFMLTGVRGVGKTTTARILARALNYSKPGLPDKPTVELDGFGEHCAGIIQSNHPDVLEMDAASNTGVDNIREIIESARYRPLTARYKVFIIDEVHMLSKGAFNALLKTLEEPPEHVKFIFATTEIRRVPVTVLSRCQRFDLRRVEVPVLVDHFSSITRQEGATAEDDALRLIARAAEGSVRDGLSILDQAIAMGATGATGTRGTRGSASVTTESVRAMLGLADRGRIFDLLELLLSGKVADALDAFETLHRDGADPAQVLTDLSETVHATARIQAAGKDAVSSAMSGEERARAGVLAERLSVPLLARIWQMLLKGIEEAGRAPNPLAATEMVLIRIAHTADLPTPDEIIKAIGGAPVQSSAAPTAGSSGGGGGGATASSGRRPVLAATGTTGRLSAERQPQADPALPPIAMTAEPAAPVIGTFDDVLAVCGAHRDARLKIHLEEHVSLVSFTPGHIEIFPLPGAPKGLAGELGGKLSEWTGMRWVVSVGREMGQPTRGEVMRAERAARIEAAKQNPAVASLLQAFPDAQVVDVRDAPKQKTDRQDGSH